MATNFPNQIFPTMEDIKATDAALVMAYQQAMKDGDINRAQTILATIPNYNSKIITADLLNSILDILYTKMTVNLNNGSTLFIFE